MSRASLVCALFVVAATSLVAQNSQSNPYAGTSSPPPDDTIIDNTPQAPAAKPPAVHYAQPAAPVQPTPAPAMQAQPPAPVESFTGGANPGDPDGDIVHVAPSSTGEPALNQRPEAPDPDGDIVHPAPPPPGVLGEGTQIRVRLLDTLSTAMSQSGETFHTRVASDVFRGNDVLIPAGSEIDGTVVQVSMGHTGGHGSMLLRPETVIMPNGSHYRLYAQLTDTPGSNTHVNSEGTVIPGSRLKKDGIEYGGAVGAGAVTGAVLGGPAGALAGTLIGAGAITVHLLVDHPQATLESGTALIFALTEPLNLVPASQQASAGVAQTDSGVQPASGAVSQ
jgi:hypothetical protein